MYKKIIQDLDDINQTVECTNTDNNFNKLSIPFNFEQMHVPNICPHCNMSVKFTVLSQAKIAVNELATIFECPACHKAVFANGLIGAGGTFVTYSGQPVYPTHKYTSSFSKNIQDLSPIFVKIYEQAMQAKIDGLDELCGMGLRKAVEILVHDYLLNIQKVEESTLKNNTFFKNLKLLDNAQAKISANVVRLAGNSEVHIFKDMIFDIDDMIKCIDMLTTFLTFQMQAIEYDQKTPENKKP